MGSPPSDVTLQPIVAILAAVNPGTKVSTVGGGPGFFLHPVNRMAGNNNSNRYLVLIGPGIKNKFFTEHEFVKIQKNNMNFAQNPCHQASFNIV
jgi:hypothetical protein